MTRIALWILALGLCLACGGYYEEYDPEIHNEVELDPMPAADHSLTDKIYMPLLYGAEKSNGKKCEGTWDMCQVPDFRDFTITVNQYTCPNQFFADQILDAANWIRDLANANGWTIDVIIGQPPPAGTSKWIIDCQTGPSNKLGETSFSGGFLGPDCHDSSKGEICQYRESASHIYYDSIQEQSGWATADITEQGRSAENTGRHELAHMFGIAHPYDTGTTLMHNAGPHRFAALQTMTNDEKRALDCYTPGSSTNPNC
jgi:hypothetical protein